jgi:hypothetical protein
MSLIPSKIFKWYTKSTIFEFFLFYLYFHICMSFFYNFHEDGFKWCILTYKKCSLGRGLKRHTLEFILVINFGWSKLSIWGDQLWNPITTKHWLILSQFFFSHGSILCILQLSCLQIWILFTQEYAMAFWMKTITKSTRFCLSLYIPTCVTFLTN